MYDRLVSSRRACSLALASIAISSIVLAQPPRRVASITLGHRTTARSGYESASPPPADARSIEVLDDGTPILRDPRRGARYGALAKGTRLAFGRRVFGEECAGAYYEIVPRGYVCETHVAASASEPGGIARPHVPPGATLPFEYAFVHEDATPAYASPRDYANGDYIDSLGAGYGLAVMGHVQRGGVDFIRTRGGRFIERTALRFARGSDFGGVTLAEGRIDVAWTKREAAVLASARGRAVRHATKREMVRVTSVDRTMAQLDDGTFVRRSDLQMPTLATRPDGVGEHERWVDVDVRNQTLVAYDGDTPIYATLVSTGRGGAARETPRGLHRIWIKLALSDMDDLERDDVERNYAIQNVPWVQYFEESNGFHAAFWHDDFGRARSHGCVNLAPRDAQWLFRFTTPAMPDGWTAVFPTDEEPGTAVWVH